MEDVVEAGEDGEGGDYGVDGWEVEAFEVWADGGDEDEDDADYLDEGAGFAEPGGFEAAEAGHHIYCSGDGDDADVAADDGGGHPEGNRQMTGGAHYAGQSEHYEGGGHQEFVGDGVDDRAELGFLLHTTGDEAVDAVCDARNGKHRQREALMLIHQ